MYFSLLLGTCRVRVVSDYTPHMLEHNKLLKLDFVSHAKQHGNSKQYLYWDDLGWNYDIEKDGPKNEVKKEKNIAIDLWFLGKTNSKNNIL